jgi:uncharacterized protein YbaR (Trm112 family)
MRAMAGREHEMHGLAAPTPAATEAPAARPDRRLLTMLVCPSTRTGLIYDAARRELISRAARLAYPIRDGVPVMTPDEARPLHDEELRALAKRCGPEGQAV